MLPFSIPLSDEDRNKIDTRNTTLNAVATWKWSPQAKSSQGIPFCPLLACHLWSHAPCPWSEPYTNLSSSVLCNTHFTCTRGALFGFWSRPGWGFLHHEIVCFNLCLHRAITLSQVTFFNRKMIYLCLWCLYLS